MTSSDSTKSKFRSLTIQLGVAKWARSLYSSGETTEQYLLNLASGLIRVDRSIRRFGLWEPALRCFQIRARPAIKVHIVDAKSKTEVYGHRRKVHSGSKGSKRIAKKNNSADFPSP
jgi:hypothetical protein